MRSDLRIIDCVQTNQTGLHTLFQSFWTYIEIATTIVFAAQVIIVTTINIAKKAMLTIVNNPRYFFKLWGLCLRYSFKVIKLASDDIIIPSDPILTEISSSLYSSVNFDKNIAVGTLLINWQERIPARRVFWVTIPEIKSLMADILAIFPEKIKNTQNVANKA